MHVLVRIVTDRCCMMSFDFLRESAFATIGHARSLDTLAAGTPSETEKEVSKSIGFVYRRCEHRVDSLDRHPTWKVVWIPRP